MADIIKLVSGVEFRTKQELINYSNAQYVVLQNAVNQVEEMKKKLAHAEEMLLITAKVETIIKTPEQCMIEQQIDRLVESSNARQLNNEEVKILDILIRNKLLLSGQPTTIPGSEKPKRILSPAQLTLIAQKGKDDDSH